MFVHWFFGFSHASKCRCSIELRRVFCPEREGLYILNAPGMNAPIRIRCLFGY